MAVMQHKVACTLAIVLLLVLSTLAKDQTESCAVAPRARSNCGESGITATECEAKGCCFNSTVRGYPWCFHPVTIDEPTEEECPF